MTDKELFERFQSLLDRMVECRRYPNEFREEAHDAAIAEIATFPREPRVLAALDRAIGRSKRRRAEAVYLLGALTDIPGAVERVGDLLREGDAETRSWLVQITGSGRLKSLAPVLNDIMVNDPDENCREFAIRAAGNLRADVNFPALLALAADPGPISEYSRIPGNILWALKDYARPECRPHLQRAFEKPTNLEDPTIAAWGLCKLGPHPEAHAHLVGLLGDEHRDEDGDFSGVGLRAAQALADVHGWPFKWGQKGVQAVLKRLRSQTT
ncbi:MAG: hypothetical protein K8U57_12390 [Planctomycetes bacterium]|nr:hypothetical protein [Planctomycetota bacterium]